MSANHRFETLAEMAGKGLNLRASCCCGHRGTLSGRQLSRLFFLRRWDGRKHMLRDRLRCSICGARPERVEPWGGVPDAAWSGPRDEAAWRRLAARLRG